MKSKKLPVEFSVKAETDIIEIFEFIAKHSISSALKVIRKLKNSTRDLNVMPEKYPKYSNLINSDRNVRCYPIDSYKIFYEIKPKKITVIRIFHTAQSPDKLKTL